MRVCIVLEGCYPYVRGGVSSWVHGLISANPEYEYVLWVIGAKAEDRGKFKYELPKNVAEVHEIFLDDALRLTAAKKDVYKFSKKQIGELKKLVLCDKPDWDILFKMYNEDKVSAVSFLMSETFLNILLDVCENDYPYVAFADFFHTIRSMFLPILYLLGADVPKADIYHSTATGYGGVLACLGAWKEKKPCIITEHGIYTREREEELLRAKWVLGSFRQKWIDLFYMMSHCAYQRADSVTSLFTRASYIQRDLGCDEHKLKVIANGIHADKFSKVPKKVPDGYIDITAIIRIHPIKDVKTLIQAFFAMKQRVPNAKLHILGDTDDKEYEAECRSLIQKLNVKDIDMPGTVNVLEYIENTDFTVLSSISEGQPLSVLESLAAGRPCVTTEVGCCRELLEGDVGDELGKAGIIVPPMHPSAMAAALETMALNTSMRDKMGEIGKNRVLSFYMHKDMVNNYNKNYEEVYAKWLESASN